MKSRLVTIERGVWKYQALAFWCPGCEETADGERYFGAHMLPVAGDVGDQPRWEWDGDLDAPTLSPSILTSTEHTGRSGADVGLHVCHSFLRAGVFEFLGDCTHAYAGQSVPLPDMPDWFAHNREERT